MSTIAPGIQAEVTTASLDHAGDGLTTHAGLQSILIANCAEYRSLFEFSEFKINRSTMKRCHVRQGLITRWWGNYAETGCALSGF